MRRFLDWTAAQTGAGQFPSNQITTTSQSHHQHHFHRNPNYSTSTSNDQISSLSQNSARDLELQHLTKLLHEIKYYQASSSPLPSAASSQNQREFVEKVHKTLPLFLNIFGGNITSANHMFHLPSDVSSVLSPSPCLDATATTAAALASSSSMPCSASPTSFSRYDSLSAAPLSPSFATKPNSPIPPPRSPQMERFPDLLPFAFTIARLFVSEVRQRASNKHAEDASLAILKFLDSNDTVESNIISSDSEKLQHDSADSRHGWNLLLSLNTLALSQNAQLIQLLCDASLPSTLIKCLYLFFDLPTDSEVLTPIMKSPLSKTNDKESSEITPSQIAPNQAFFAREICNGTLVKAFTQLLVQLCSYQSAIDELIKKDDLRLLVGIASSQCSIPNRPWRKAAFQALLAISKNMRDNFMYIEQNLCIQVFVENLHRINSLGLTTMEEFIDMIRLLIEFLYNLDVNNRNQTRSIGPLIEQFKASRIIDLIEELILKIDEVIVSETQQLSQQNQTEVDRLGCRVSQQPSVSSEVGVCLDDYRRYGRKLIQSLTLMAKINISPDAIPTMSTLKPLAMSRFEMLEQFKMPRPSAKDCILNEEALRLLKLAWSKCRDNHLIEAILDATISLFNDDKYNYFIFESHQLLVYYMTSPNFSSFPYKVKQKLFKFLEFIIIETNYIPCLELGTLGTIIKKPKELSSSTTTATTTTSTTSLAATTSTDKVNVLCLKTLIACLRFDPRFSDIFRDIGLLEVTVELLMETMQHDNLNQHNTDKLEVLYLLLEASQYLLAGPNNSNCTQFNESGAARHVFNCLSKPKFFQLFLPAHSSSSDDGGPGVTSRANTPTPTAKQNFLRSSPMFPRQHSNQWLDQNLAKAQMKPSIKQIQKVAFTIIRQLILSSAADEHLANLLGLLERNLDDLKNLAIADKLIGDFDPTNEQDPASFEASKVDFTFLLSQEINLKICILKSLMIILKDSHRCRALFRKVGGFIYIISSLIVLEKALPLCEPHNEGDLALHNRWRKINQRRIWRLIKNCLMTIVVAMRSEPANLRAFADDVIEKFLDALRRLGCFKVNVFALESAREHLNGHQASQAFESYKSIFLAPPARDFSIMATETMRPNEACCQLFRFLYDMSLDMSDATSELETQLDKQTSIHKSIRSTPSPTATTNQQQPHHTDTKSMSFDYENTTNGNSSVFTRRSQMHRVSLRPPSLDLKESSADKAILKFPCIISGMLDLIPSCPSDDLMVFVCMVLKSLFKHERNQQLLCDAGMISRLLHVNWRLSLTDKSHFLFQFSQFMLEKLTKQSITAKELRTFLRLGEPLKCKNLDEIDVTESFVQTRQKLIEQKTDQELTSLNDGNHLSLASVSPTKIREKISTDRIESFVAMMSDKSRRQPPFVEFDLGSDGCSFIFMPSIAPVNAKSLPVNSSSFLNSTLDVHTTEKNGILGGLGSLERQFPPINGLTFSTWICIETFPARSSDANHNLRLLTIYRGSAATGKEFSCLRIQVSALDRALTISTQEVLLFDNETKADAQIDPDCLVRVWSPELLVEGRWHHLAVTISRSVAKPGTICVYVDGCQVHNQKICYINTHVGATNLGPLGTSSAVGSTGTAAAFVNAFIGSLPQFRMHLRTQWKQGPCHLIEEALNSNFIAMIHSLGPDSVGNFQCSNKLYELVKVKTYSNNDHNKLSKQESNQHHHKPLTHQQSAIMASPRVIHNAQLTRVSSSNLGSSSSASVVHHQSSSSSNGNGSLVSFNLHEDRILMNIDARATSLMTLSRMRRVYTRFDCRQVSRVLGVALHENSIPVLLLHNTGVHLNGPSRGIGAIAIGYNQTRCFVPNPTEQTLVSIGGCYVLIGFIAQAQSVESLMVSLKAFVCALKSNPKLQAQMDNINGYQILSVMLRNKKHLLNNQTLELIHSLIVDSSNQIEASRSNLISNDYDQVASVGIVPMIQQVGALRELICESFDLWLQTEMINIVLEFIYNLINSTHHEHKSSSRSRNLKFLRDMDLLPRMLRLLLQHDSQQVYSSQQLVNNGNSMTTRLFDAQAVYLIKQIVFELLNRTPRQPDILYFGQFLASLLPSDNKERSEHTINLRNILLKSLLQMMTKNKQKEVNNAMQEELVRILGFDWFMLFISSSHLDQETINIGFLNLMILLSNDELYSNFKTKTPANGGWLKEPTFTTMDSNSNIQLLGMNVSAFFGLNGRRKSMKQDVLEAPNFFLLTNCLSNLINLPRIYLMIFLTMTNRLTKLDSSVLDTIESFEKLNLDILCDCLIGDTHHKRRQTLSNIQFKCHELVVCLVYMLRDIMNQYKSPNDESESSIGESLPLGEENQLYQNYPTDVIRFFMYLYNNNLEFQSYCKRSDELIDAICETLILQPNEQPSSRLHSIDEVSISMTSKQRSMTQHPASKEVLELSRLIILDKMTELFSNNNLSNNDYCNVEQLHSFDRFMDSLASCREAQGHLVDVLLRQILLMIDSTARHNSIKTIGGSENILQFQLLLINSITISQTITDKLWLSELYVDDFNSILTTIEHQLCLAEQIFKFNELLPKHNPPHAFIMQRVLNRILLFALSQPMQHMSDKMSMIDLLKKIHDNRTIIILNHMHSPQSAEFFVCLTYCLMRLIEENSIQATRSPQHQSGTLQSIGGEPSLIEKQFVQPARESSSSANEMSSSDLMLVSMARKVWDSVYQSKKGILSEAFDVSLSLPAFTLETSLDLLQLKPNINDCCERYWSSLLESELKPKKRIQPKPSDPSTGTTAASSAVNLLSGRLTRVVNAANFVSRVVGATAGTMASNVNLVGEKFTNQTRVSRQESSNLSRMLSNDASQNSPIHQASSGAHQSQRLSGQQLQSQLSTSQANAGANMSSSSVDQSELFKYPRMTRLQVQNAHQTHISIIEDYIRSQLSQKNHKLALHKYLCDEWLEVEDEILLRERALFGPDYGSKLDKWCLDMTEGPRRMRKKMVNNTRQFYDNYPYRPEQYNPDNKSLRYRPPMSYDSHLYYMKTLNLDCHLLELTAAPSSDDAASNEMKQSSEQSLKVTSKQTNESLVVNSPLEPISESTKQAEPERPTLNVVSGDHQATVSMKSPTINIDSPKSPLKAPSNEAPIQSSSVAAKSPSQSKDFHHSSIESLTSPANLGGGGSNRPSPSSPRPSDCDLDGDGDSTSFVDFSPEIEAETNSARESENIDSLSVLRLLESNERISHMFRCSRVQGLDTYEGLLLFGREHFYLIDGFTLLKTREIKDIDSLPPDAHDPIIPNSTPNLMAHSKKTCAKFSFDSVVEVHKRRYLLQPIALEVFSSDGRNTLIVFPRNIRNKVYSRLMTVSTQLTSNAHESLAGQKSSVSVEGGSGLLSNLIGETSVTQRWVRGELSNFQYLMNLNTIAGRSYNDLMQYPIFPWILADYTSDHLDLTKASSFRDLSRPVGAQTSERLDQFKRRYSDWDDSETPPYHYGTFYSSAMIVASYMVRMEPFTQHFLRLQGGHFDLADRMFHSIHDSWLSASKHNMADIKELIPEFYYLPEFLKNDNKYDLGLKQNGMKLDDVILPPWAKNDAREFIRLHRCALESDYVSAHLHEWIDLIFGYKQQGQAAVEAVNVFHHLFYEGNVDIYNTDIDPIKKNAVIGFINNFGQVPKQLFKKAHPARKVISSSGYASGHLGASTPLTPILPSLSGASIGPNSQQKTLTIYPQALRQLNVQTLKDLRGPVGQIVQIDKNIVAVEQNKLLIPPEYCRYVAWGHADRSLRLSLYDSEKPVFVWEGSDSLMPNEVLCCTIPNSRTMITAGRESIITVWKIEKMRSFSPILNLYGHVEPVTCLASSQSYSLIVSGSRDRTAIVWDLNRFTFVRQLGSGPQEKLVHHGPISSIAINDSTGDIATCASSWLYLWSINGDLLAQVDSFSITIQQSMCGSGVGGGICSGVSAPSMSSNISQLHLLSVCFSQYNEWDSNEVIITGASDGSVAIWSLRYYQCPMTETEIEEANVKARELNACLDIQDQDESQQTKENGEQEQLNYSGNVDGSGQPSIDDASPAIEQAESTHHHHSAPPSEPIAIVQESSFRKRTDTMGSEWVRLSASSSASTADTIPILLQNTPTSQNDPLLSLNDTQLTSGDFASGSYNATADSPSLQSSAHSSQRPAMMTNDTSNEGLTPRCSTPIANTSPDIDSHCTTSSATLLAQQQQQPRELRSSVDNLSALNNNESCQPDASNGNESANFLLNPNDPTLIKFSKSDTSLVESFVLLDESISSPMSSGGHPLSSHRSHSNRHHQQSSNRPQSSFGTSSPSTATQTQPAQASSNQTRARRRLQSTKESRFNPRTEPKLQPNYKWKRELYLRSLLPRRMGKIMPAPVTSLAISKDHKTLYIGDSSGRISCWSTN